MEIILKKDIANLGFKGDIVTVKQGYARNYLLPQGYAINATPAARKMQAENLKQQAHKEEKIKNEALALAEKLKDLKLTLGAKASSKGKIFGSVNTIQLSESLQKAGFDIDRKIIVLKDDAVKELGSFTAEIRLHKEVRVNVAFEVVGE